MKKNKLLATAMIVAMISNHFTCGDLKAKTQVNAKNVTASYIEYEEVESTMLPETTEEVESTMLPETTEEVESTMVPETTTGTAATMEPSIVEKPGALPGITPKPTQTVVTVEPVITKVPIVVTAEPVTTKVPIVVTAEPVTTKVPIVVTAEPVTTKVPSMDIERPTNSPKPTFTPKPTVTPTVKPTPIPVAKVKYVLYQGKNDSRNPDMVQQLPVYLYNAKKSGYIFEGWYTEKNYVNKVKSVCYSGKENITLYAKWSKVIVKKAVVSSAKRINDKKIRVKVKKIEKVDGYEYVISTTATFSKKTRVISKLNPKDVVLLQKGKVYYIKVRAYKLDSYGKKKYGSYSKVKKCSL